MKPISSIVTPLVHRIRLSLNVLLPVLLLSATRVLAVDENHQGVRATHPVNSDWTYERLDSIEAEGVQPIVIGQNWENAVASPDRPFMNFDGVAIYRQTIDASGLREHGSTTPREHGSTTPREQGSTTPREHGSTIPQRSRGSGRWLLEIDGSATAAKVRVGGEEVGRHLGGWTPFRVDVTQAMQASDTMALSIEVDEKVGHNTQGFLPIVVPHFGGIWKQVRLIHTQDSVYLDDLTLLLSGFAPAGLKGHDTLAFDLSLRGALSNQDPQPEKAIDYDVGLRIVGPTDDVRTDWEWHRVGAPKPDGTMRAAGTDALLGSISGTIRPPKIQRWSPTNPFLYEIEIALRKKGGQIVDRLARRAAIRHFEARGRQLLVNGKTVNVRGVLNWGYAPPQLSPSLDEASMRRELEFAKQRGFNLMKFCLWLPPKRYLELADEMGMLTWIEYPTWHPDFGENRYEELTDEFAEFFYYDRNTAGAILRSLTCETGHSASVDVIQGLYDLGHSLIPGAILEDDSSWIEWHRVHDFYDDHPYGNNHDWLATLDRLDTYIRQRNAKPLVLGEAIAADTWEPTNVDGSEPATPHASLSASAQPQYLRKTLISHALEDDESIRTDSYRYALLMRKYQAEAFRWRLPDAGYVMSVIRDFPKASMGLIDRWGSPKWSAQDFQWQSPVQLVLNQGIPIRSLAGGTTWKAEIDVAGENAFANDLDLEIGYRLGDQSTQTLLSKRSASQRSDQAVFAFQFDLPDVSRPTRLTLETRLAMLGKTIATNAWELWVFPDRAEGTSSATRRTESSQLVLGEGVTASELAEWGIRPEQIMGTVTTLSSSPSPSDTRTVILAKHFEPGLLEAIESGARCVMLPDGAPGSFVMRDHWFLRGGPIIGGHSFVDSVSHACLVDLQSMDLAGPVLHDFPLLDEGTAILSLWDNHDIDHYRTHSLLWESRIGDGLLICSALNHGRQSGEAGPYLLKELLDLAAGPIEAKPMSSSAIEKLHQQIQLEQVSIANQPWQFRRASEADMIPAESGHLSRAESVSQLNPDWLKPPVPTTSDADETWQAIQVTSHWDGQGHADWDGWGLYRLELDVPEKWLGQNLYVTFTGVDDYFEVFAGGQALGSGGDIAKHETAFELVKSFEIPAALVVDGVIDLRVSVYDWYGAGGIFRPIYLGTQPLPEGPSWIVQP
jgi:hypothetical protein